MGTSEMTTRGMIKNIHRLKPGLAMGCAALAMLAACANHHHPSYASAGGYYNNPYAGEDTAYYLAHARSYYPQPGPASDPWGPYIREAARRFDVPAIWIRQVMQIETGGREYTYGRRLTVSGAGAMGLMQLEPGTYQEMEIRYGLSNDPFNPLDNIMAGAAYIHEMYQIYGSPGFLAAYNCGPGRLDAYIHYHRPLPDQTITYVAMIAPNIDGYYPRHRSSADELALNTEPMGDDGGILPRGFVPIAPTQAQLSAPVEVASLAPVHVPQPQQPGPVTVPVSSIMPQVARIEAARAQPVHAAPAMPPPAPVEEAALPAPAPSMAPAVPNPALLFASEHTAAPAPRPAIRTASYMPHHSTYGQHYLTLPPAQAPAPIQTPVQQASARVVPATPGFNTGSQSWGIQVGAYGTQSDARAALGQAERSGWRDLSGAQQVVMRINVHGDTEYRARFVGLQREAAESACSRLSGSRTGCVVLPPI